MAHFALVNARGIVEQVIVAEQDVIDSGLFGSPSSWVQTSYNGNFRCRYAGVGAYYDEERDIFSNTQVSPSWIFDSENNMWVAPIPIPFEELVPKAYQFYHWDEETTSWIENTPV